MFIAFCFAIRIFDKNPMFRSERCSLGTRLKIGYGSSEKQNWPESNQTVQSATKKTMIQLLGDAAFLKSKSTFMVVTPVCEFCPVRILGLR